MTGLLAVNGLFILILVNFPALWLSIAMIFLCGLPLVGYLVALDTLLQQHVQDHYRGRVFGALATSAAIFVLFGQGLASSVGDTFGIVPLLNLKGTLDIMAGLLALILLYRISAARSDFHAELP